MSQAIAIREIVGRKNTIQKDTVLNVVKIEGDAVFFDYQKRIGWTDISNIRLMGN